MRDYVHVSDIVDAHIMALNQLLVPSDVYNLGSSTGYSNLQVIDAARGVMHHPINVDFGPRREGDPAKVDLKPVSPYMFVRPRDLKEMMKV